MINAVEPLGSTPSTPRLGVLSLIPEGTGQLCSREDPGFSRAMFRNSRP
jgi:hypothetical protein